VFEIDTLCLFLAVPQWTRKWSELTDRKRPEVFCPSLMSERERSYILMLKRFWMFTPYPYMASFPFIHIKIAIMYSLWDHWAKWAYLRSKWSKSVPISDVPKSIVIRNTSPYADRLQGLHSWSTRKMCPIYCWKTKAYNGLLLWNNT